MPEPTDTPEATAAPNAAASKASTANDKALEIVLRQRETFISQLTAEHTRTLIEHAAKTAVEDAGGDFEAIGPLVMPKLGAFADKQQPWKFTVAAIDARDPKSPASSVKGAFKTAAEIVAELVEHPVTGRMFQSENTLTNSLIDQSKTVHLNPAQARDPKIYQQLKKRRERGEISAVFMPDGRRLL